MIAKWPFAVGLALAAVLCWVGCAPVHLPNEKDNPAPSEPTGGIPPESLNLPPTPLAAPSQDRVLRAIEHVRNRDLLTTNGFWTVFHGILGLGFDITLRDPQTGTRYNAVEYIAGGGEMRGLQFNQTRYGLDVQMGPISVGQGHQDQFVAEMAQWGMPADKVFLVQGKEFTFMDFVNHSKMRARTNGSQELGWAVLVIGQYLGTDIEWTNGSGEKLRFEDLVRYEVNLPLDTAACGGTHSLFGISWVYHLHRAKGGEKTGVWADVVEKTIKHRDLAKKYQNPDGTFSTDFFRGPGNLPDPQLRINTTGHTLEWLSLALPDEELKQPWVENAANALSLLILSLHDSPIEGGSLYHAVHGLSLYHARLHGLQQSGAQAPHFPPPPPGPLK